MKNLLKISIPFIIYTIGIQSVGHAQFFPLNTGAYVDSIVPRIDVTINSDSLAALYQNIYTEHEYPATFVFSKGAKKDTLFNVGFTIRGNTSRQSAKKSFKLSFNTFVVGRKYSKVEKLHLNGEHNDPSIIRSKLCWDLLRKCEIPAPRANHVDLYINNNYYGLYINVENIDENFADSRFGNKDGNLFKCLGGTLQYIDNNPESYKIISGNHYVYDLKINDLNPDYTDLIHFISVLNNTSDNQFTTEIEKVFNIDNYLKVIAVDILTGNWDGYLYDFNNYYLYHNTITGKFEYVPYDLDNTFGIDWFGIDWGTRDIYHWANVNCPLYDRIMNNPVYKARFSTYMDNILDNYFNAAVMFPEIDSRENLIKASAQQDTYRTMDYGWSYNDFLNSYNDLLGAHVKYGIKPYINTRNANAKAQLILTGTNTSKSRDIKVFPNPFSQQTNIQSDASPTDLNVIIYNTSGTIVFTKIISHGETITSWNGSDVTGNRLPNGIYFLTIGNNESQVYKSKIVLMR